MSTHLPGFQSFFSFFATFGIVKLASSSIRVKVKGTPPLSSNLAAPLLGESNW